MIAVRKGTKFKRLVLAGTFAAGLLALLAVGASALWSGSASAAPSPAPAHSSGHSVVVAPLIPGPGLLDYNALTYSQAKSSSNAFADGSTIEVAFNSVPGLNLNSLNISGASYFFDDSGETITFTGSSLLFGGVLVDVMLTAIWNGNPTPDMVLGVRKNSFQLSELGFSGPLSSFSFPQTGFQVIGSGGPLSISSADLSPEAFDFFKNSYPTGAFTLDLVQGINLSGVLTLSEFPSVFLDSLGANPASNVLIHGSVGADFRILDLDPAISLTGLSLTATLPPMQPAVLPAWLTPTPGVDTTVAVSYDGANTVVDVTGSLDADPDGQALTFDVAFQLDMSATEGSYQLVASLSNTPWDDPFDVGWLSLSSVDLTLSSELGGGLPAAWTRRSQPRPRRSA